jgi:Protein of unknown function (DUF3800)
VVSETLSSDADTAIAFLDESGAISHDRFFAVGCLKLAEPSVLLRQIQKLRDQHHWYGELHWVDITKDSVGFYRNIIDVIAKSDAEFSCFVVDRESADAMERFGSSWRAYEKIATQLLIGSIRPGELVTVLADNYSAPDEVVFEQDVKREVNRRLGRLAVTNVCRLDSKAADPLQLVDLLTSGVTFEFRQAAGLAGKRSPKARLAKHLRTAYNADSFLKGCRRKRMNVQIYRGGAKWHNSN